VHVLEVAIGKLVAALGMLAFVFIDAEKPFLIFGEPVFVDELIFLLSRGLVLAPGISFIMHGFAARDEVSCVLI
jgi:hypothetical protein